MAANLPQSFGLMRFAVFFIVLVSLAANTLRAEGPNGDESKSAQERADRFSFGYNRHFFSPSDPSPEEMEIARERIYISIGGFLGEGLRPLGYFKAFKRDLIRWGISRDQIIHLQPPSNIDMLTNSREFLASKFDKITSRSTNPNAGKMLVVYPHSKAVGEMGAYALQNGQFVTENISDIFNLSGAGQGSKVADKFTFQPIEYKGKPHWIVCALMNCVLVPAQVLRLAVNKGMVSITTEASKRMWQQLHSDHADAVPLVSNRSLFIRTFNDPALQSPVLRLTARFLKAASGDEVDGLVELEGQINPGMTSRVVTLKNTDHTLPCEVISAFAQRPLNRALNRAIIYSVARP